MSESFFIERLQARIAELEGAAANQQRIEILPIGTRIKMAPFGEGVVRQASVSIDGETVVKHCVRFNDGFIAWAEDLYGGPIKVLSRPARKVTLVIEEEELASKEYYDRLDASCAAQLEFEEQERQSERDKRLLEADRLVRASLDRENAIAPF